MARCKLTPQEFIQNTFSPMIAVLTSTAVENVCRKNNLSFIQMLRPFCKLSTEGHLRDPSGAVITIKNLRLTLCDVNWRPPEPPVARTYFNECVSSYATERTTPINIGTSMLEIPVSVPWYEAWRHTFLQVQFPSDHEFTKHYVGCILVVSTSDTSPLESLAELVEKLQGLMSEAPTKLPKWFGPAPFVLVAYLLLHDNTTGESITGESTFEAMKTTYGVGRCFYLSINSQTPGASNNSHAQLPDPWAQFISSFHHFHERPKDEDISQGVETAQEAGEKTNLPPNPVIIHPLSPLTEETTMNTPNGHVFNEEPDRLNIQHGQYLTAEDINKIRLFVNDLCLKALIPHFEHQIHALSEQVSNKKGVSRSLFSATKRWFGTSKPGTPGNNIPPTAITYACDSHELQLRRLGDLCFMIGHYSLAFTAYHSAKRDFGADGAWLHYAGALEMAALSAFMSNSEAFSKKCIDYAEESITVYLNQCRMPQFATRATILSVECLKGKLLYGEAANQLIRMTSEDSDLRSAVLLEQAAYCFLHSQRPVMHRKYAFHMVMAGHRYSKAGHKVHSIRCYRQAYQVYEGKWWSVAEDHINFTVGKQSAQLKQSANAVEAFSRLVTRSSRQSAIQQQTFIKEYITTIQQLESESHQIGILSIPVIKCKNIQVLLGHPLNREHVTDFIPASGICFENGHHQSKPVDDSKWKKMEERLVTFSQGMTAMVFKPTVELFTNKTDNSASPVIVVGEVVSLCVDLKNPLHVSLKLSDVSLIWNMTQEEENQFPSEPQYNEVAYTESIKEITIHPNSTKHIVLTITASRVGELHITGLAYTLIDPNSGSSVQGKQPFCILPFKPDHKEDKRLHMIVVKQAPYMHVHFQGLKDDFICGEIVPVQVKVKNSGMTSISKVLLTSTGSFTMCMMDQSQPVHEVESCPIIEFPLDGPLKTNESRTSTIFVRAPIEKCEVDLDLLFYYEGTDYSKSRYRLVRHSWPTNVHKFVSMSAKAIRSNLSLNCEDGINIKIELCNNSKVDEPHSFKLYLDTVSVCSEDWRLATQIFSPDDLSINSQESLLVMVQALRQSKSKRKNDSQITSMKFKADSSIKLYKAFIPGLPSTLDYSELHAVCIISWMGEIIFHGGECQNIVGQDHLILTYFDQMFATTTSPNVVPMKIFGQTPAESTDIQHRLISYQIIHPPKIVFTSERLCIIPVKLILHNCSDLSVNIKVEALSIPTNLTDNSVASICFAWIGQTTFFRDVEGLSNTIISLNAAITAPGAYDMSSRLTVSARTKEELIVQTCKPEAVVIVS